MESPLTQFIALASYRAEDITGRPELSETLVEKLLAVTHDILRIRIEGLEVKPSRYGVQSRWRLQTLFVEPQLLDLKRLQSKHFDRVKIPRGHAFVHTPHFRQSFARLSHKPHIGHFEHALDALLRVSLVPNGLDNLIYLSMACSPDGGLRQVATDIEIMLLDLWQYVRSELYLERERRKSRAPVVRERLYRTKSAVHRKIGILRSASATHDRISELGERSTLIQRTLSEAGRLRSDAFFLVLAEKLIQWIIELSDIILDESSELPVFQPVAVKQLKRVLAQIESAVYREPTPVVATNTSDQLGELMDLLTERMHAWLRAIAGHYDEDYFRKHERQDTLTPWHKNVIVCYDLRGNGPRFDRSVEQGSMEAIDDYTDWRERFGAVLRNWAILFDGLILLPVGDKEITFLPTINAGVNTLALSLEHLEILSEHDRVTGRMGMAAKAGIGIAPVLFTGGQEKSQQMDHMYHAIKAIPDISVPNPPQDSVALALRSFAEENTVVRSIADLTAPLSFKDGEVVPLDYRRCTAAYLAQLIEGPAGETSSENPETV